MSGSWLPSRARHSSWHVRSPWVIFYRCDDVGFDRPKLLAVVGSFPLSFLPVVALFSCDVSAKEDQTAKMHHTSPLNPTPFTPWTVCVHIYHASLEPNALLLSLPDSPHRPHVRRKMLTYCLYSLTCWLIGFVCIHTCVQNYRTFSCWHVRRYVTIPLTAYGLITHKPGPCTILDKYCKRWKHSKRFVISARDIIPG